MTTPALDPDPLRRAFARLADDVPPPATCPAPDRLWEASRGELPAGESRMLVLHTAECPSCAEAWRLALELRTEGAEAASIVARARWRGRGLPLAAALAAMALAGALLRQDGAQAPPRDRSPERGGIRALTPEERPLQRAACVVRWSSAGEGARYDLRVATPALVIVHSARNLEATEHQVPPSALAALPPGSRLLWQVEAVRADGTRVASPTFMVRLE